MKVSKFMLLVLLFSTVLFNYSCKKGDPGAKGDTGPAGAIGATGPQGPSGVAGNANVTQYTYQSVTFTTNKDYVITNITQAKIDSSLILAYYMTNGSTAWYPVGGIGPSGYYFTRYYVWPATPTSFYFSVRLLTTTNSEYTSAVTFTKFRIIIATASSILNLRRKGQVLPDVNDYESVRQYYNLPE